MMDYLIKRLLLMIPTLFGITLITFFIMKLAPGDPIMLKLMFVGEGIAPEALAAQLQSEKPVIELPKAYLRFAASAGQFVHGKLRKRSEIENTFTYKSFRWIGENTVFYVKWLGNIVKLDFGLAFKDKQPVSKKIWEALPVTLLINVVTVLIIYLVSIPLGIWSAVKQGSVIDKIVMVKLFIFYSLPTFWVATMLLMLFAGGEYFDMFPLIGIVSDDFAGLSFFGKLLDISWHLFLPVLASVIGSFAFLSRFSRSNFLDVIRQDYIRTARAKGLTESVVLFKHGLRNAMIPFVTLMGTLLPGLLGGSVVIEQIFSIPGMGMLSFEAVLGRDHNVIMAIATISAFLTLVGLLISDFLYTVVDPRIKLR